MVQIVHRPGLEGKLKEYLNGYLKDKLQWQTSEWFEVNTVRSSSVTEKLSETEKTSQESSTKGMT